MKLSIIIVSYNTKKLLQDCLNSIIRNTQNLSYEIIVVDNNSTDQSPDMVKKKFSRVKLIKNARNLGFGRANNIGAQKASGEILLFLNSDTLVLGGTFKEMVKIFDQKSDVGVALPQLVTGEGKIQKGAFGLEPTLWNILTRINEDYSLRNSNQSQMVDWVSGAALFIRKKLFEKIGGFDPQYFMYFEDTDLCKRVRNLGFKIFYNADTKIIHLGGKSIKVTKDRKKIYYQSLEKFYIKHYSRIKLIILKIFLLPYKLIRHGI